MKEMNIDDMELGNLLFGHSRGNFQVDRDEWQDTFCTFLERNGFDYYGYKEDSSERYFENDVFAVRPYYWGADEEEMALPNFEYKPTAFTISWYKYPMRDAYASHNITTEEFLTILKKCEDSLNRMV